MPTTTMLRLHRCRRQMYPIHRRMCHNINHISCRRNSNTQQRHVDRIYCSVVSRKFDPYHAMNHLATKHRHFQHHHHHYHRQRRRMSHRPYIIITSTVHQLRQHILMLPLMMCLLMSMQHLVHRITQSRIWAQHIGYGTMQSQRIRKIHYRHPHIQLNIDPTVGPIRATAKRRRKILVRLK